MTSVGLNTSFDQSAGQLLSRGLVRPDLQHAARDLRAHLVSPLSPTQLEIQQLSVVLTTSEVLNITNYIYIHSSSRTTNSLLIMRYSDSDWAGDNNTRQSTSGSLITLLKSNVQSSSKTQQVIGLPTQPSPTPCTSNSSLRRLKTTSASRTTSPLWIQDLANLFFVDFQQKTAQPMLSKRMLAAARLQRHLPAVGLQTDVANEVGQFDKIFFVVDNIKKQHHLQDAQGTSLT